MCADLKTSDEHMSGPLPDISVVISTHNRSESLRTTLQCLASAHRIGINAEVVVVDNAGTDNTKAVVSSFDDHIRIRYLYEPATEGYGKVHALNRALDAVGLGDIVAVLDDDMSPHVDWFQGVISICKRWPDKDIFSGQTYIIWPADQVPGWARKRSLASWIFSSPSFATDSFLQDGQWFSGNHFWFRSRALAPGKRFKNIWLTEGDFQLDLVEQGYEGVAGPDAVAGHRVQPSLLERAVAVQRAKKTGVAHGSARLLPYRKSVKQARLFRAYPYGAWLFCMVNVLRWWVLYVASYLYPSDGSRFEHRLIALERIATYREYLRIAKHSKEYALRTTAVGAIGL